MHATLQIKSIFKRPPQLADNHSLICFLFLFLNYSYYYYFQMVLGIGFSELL